MTAPLSLPASPLLHSCRWHVLPTAPGSRQVEPEMVVPRDGIQVVKVETTFDSKEYGFRLRVQKGSVPPFVSSGPLMLPAGAPSVSSGPLKLSASPPSVSSGIMMLPAGPPAPAYHSGAMTVGGDMTVVGGFPIAPSGPIAVSPLNEKIVFEGRHLNGLLAAECHPGGRTFGAPLLFEFLVGGDKNDPILDKYGRVRYEVRYVFFNNLHSGDGINQLYSDTEVIARCQVFGPSLSKLDKDRYLH